MVEETIAGTTHSMNKVRSSDWDQHRHAPLATGLMLQRAKIAKFNCCFRCIIARDEASLVPSGVKQCADNPRPRQGQSTVSYTVVRCLEMQQIAQEMEMWIARRNVKSAKVLAPHNCGCLMSPALSSRPVLTRSDSVLSVSFISDAGCSTRPHL